MTEFASKEEEYFSWWMEELKEAGLITFSKYQPKPFTLFGGATVKYLELLKTKTKERSINLLSGHTYQADFLIYWHKSLHKVLFVDYNETLNKNIKKYPFVANYSQKKDLYFSVVDVKGTFDRNKSLTMFSVNQKWVFQIHHMYVQKIVTHPGSNGLPASALFPNTFIPRRFQLTDKGKQKRKIHYKYIFIDEFKDRYGIS